MARYKPRPSAATRKRRSAASKSKRLAESKKKICAVKYSKEQLMCAIQAVKNGLTQFAAAKKYGIPRSTLFNKISGKSEIGKKSGPGTVLSTEEETIIEKWILNLASRGFPVTKHQLLRSIQMYLNTNKRVTPFKNNFPGRKWYDNFMIRHPTIAERIAQNLTSNRAAVTVDKIKLWHAEVYKYCQDNDLLGVLNDPSRVFNMDEKGFVLTPKNQVVLTKRGDKAVYNRSRNDDKECVTVLLGGNAAGKPTPPMVIHAQKRIPASILLNTPLNWSVGISDSGWQTQLTFRDYMSNVFVKWLSDEKIPLPVIVFMDGHKSHISLTLSDFCAEHGIELVGLYPNTTHITQPMDVCVFKPVSTSWEGTLEEWKLKHEFSKVEKKDIAPILNDAINAIDYPSHLKKGFEKCGLFPFDVNNIDLSRVLPSVEASVTSIDHLWKATESAESSAVQTPPENDRQGALSRLKHFEALIDDTILNLFQLSIDSDSWSGATEYTALYIVWKKIHRAAYGIVSTADNMKVAVETSISHIECADDEIELTATPSIWILTEDGRLLTSEETDTMNVEYEEIENYESAEMDIAELCTAHEKTISEEIMTSIEVPADEGTGMMSSELDVSEGFIYNTVLVENQTSKDITPSIEVHTDEEAGLINSKLDVLEGFANDAPLDLSNKNSQTLVSSSHDNKSFDGAAFKRSFFYPKVDINKKKGKPPVEIRSTVWTSVDWRSKEKKKIEDELRAEFQKQQRKAEREMKKLEAVRVAEEKKKLKDKKKEDKLREDAEKQKQKNARKVIKSMEATAKAAKRN